MAETPTSKAFQFFTTYIQMQIYQKVDKLFLGVITLISLTTCMYFTPIHIVFLILVVYMIYPVYSLY